MIYSFSLASVAVWLGFGLLLFHAWALWEYDRAVVFLKAMPRSDLAGGILLAMATTWAAWLAGNINLMEYSNYRPLFVLAAAGLGISSWLYVREFIAVRSLGILALLAANILLDAAFLRGDQARWIVVGYAYLIIGGGMLMVGAPYLLRDAMDWGFRSAQRGKCFLALGAGFGMILIALGLFIY